ncbi:MAG TPA: ATP-binding protein [Candidatus Kapabacteria bacterium]|nr:ATP-binding protein [Candidatus Kapabacteria bacterium]
MDNLQQNESSLLSENITSLLIAIEEFVAKQANTEWLLELYKYCMNVLVTIPGTKFASIYLLSDDDFLFSHKYTQPNEYENESQALYDYLINKRVVGEVLESNIIKNFNSNNFEFVNNGIVVPLINSNKLVGLIIISNDDTTVLKNLIIDRIINIFSSLIASYLENRDLIRRLDNTQSLLEQKITQRTFDINQNKRELRTIIDSVLSGIIVYDEQTQRITRVNPIARALVGIEEGDLLGKSIFEYLDDSNTESKYNHLNLSKLAYESFLINNDKNKIPILRTTNRLFLYNKNIIIESFVDISELKKFEFDLKESNKLLEQKVKNRTEDLQLLVQKLKIEVAERERAEKELKRLLEREKELNDLKSKFVNLVSHEFRTPLTIIKSSTQMFQKFDDKLNKDEKEYYYRRIIKTVDYLNDLIENSLFIGKNENANYDLNSIQIKIHAFFVNLIDEFKNSLEVNRNVILSNEQEIEIITDERLLFLICNNLLTNAHKYSDLGENIIVAYDISDNELYIKFTDFGIGIPEEDKIKIYNQFYRGTNIGNVVGTGLGLAVVKESIEKLNGYIKFNSQLGVGTTFEVSIPIKIMQST